MVLYPAPARTTTFNGPAARIGSVTFVERTMSTSGFDSATRAASAWSFRPVLERSEFVDPIEPVGNSDVALADESGQHNGRRRYHERECDKPLHTIILPLYS